MRKLLYAVAIALLALTAWKHLTVVRFFRRPRPVSRARVGTVSILQPILSGDPTLAQTLGHNLATSCALPREFVWLVDEEDFAGQQICAEQCTAHPAANVQLHLLPRAPQGQNPKTFKLVRGLELAAGDVICVLDDDTMLPQGGLELCLPYLDAPGAGLVFGLPYQVNFSNLWSSLVAVFVNSSSLLTYIPYTTLHQPVTINGMFYALRRETLAAIGGFAGLEPILADDFAIAQRVRQHGYRLVQTPLCHAISTHVTGPRRYLSLIQRWFIFPRESIMRHLPLHEQALVYGLALFPALAPLLLLIGLVIWPALPSTVLLLTYLGYHYALTLQFNQQYLNGATPLVRSWMTPVLQLIFPLQLIAALLLPQRINWRGHVMEVEQGGGFHFVRRRNETPPPTKGTEAP
jgi:ceramide glucosyltransferase